MYIEYYAFDPFAGKPMRKREYLMHIKDEAQRKRTAKLLIREIDAKLANGWTPFAEDYNHEKQITIREAMEKIVQLKCNGAEERTIYTYRSRKTVFLQWLKHKKLELKYIYAMDKALAMEYMDWLQLEKKIGPRTYNGYLTDMRTFFNAMKERSMIRMNPFLSVSKLREKEKHRKSFSDAELMKLKNYLLQHDNDFLTVCQYCYYAILRPVEICRLKVGNIDLERRVIIINADQSKNDKRHIIPLMPELWERLKKLGIDTMPKHWYIVSKGFRPGEKHIREKNISERFKVIRETLKLPAHCEFYSLKDTAAERMIKAGYDIKFIKQLFRHHDITITDMYMSSFNPIVDEKLLAKYPTM